MHSVRVAVPRADTSEPLEEVGQAEWVFLEVELQVMWYSGAVQSLPHIDCSGIACLKAALILEVRDKGISGFYGRLIHLLNCIELLLAEDALADQHLLLRLRCPGELKAGAKLLERSIV